MIEHEFVCQPQAENYGSLFARAMRPGGINRFDVAVAYVTTPGVRTLMDILAEHAADQWDRMRKRWLVGIDWCRTEPTALDVLSQLPLSDVKIFAGREVVARRNCVPKVPFHP